MFALDLTFFRIDTQMTFLEVPHDFPRAFLEGTNTYGTFYVKMKVLSIRRGWGDEEQFLGGLHQQL